MKKIFIILAFLFLPALSLAHVKWFAEEGDYVKPYNITDVPVLFWIFSTLLLIGIGIYLERKLKVPLWLESHLSNWKNGALSLASIGFGLALIIFSLNGFVFAPNLPAVNNIFLILQFISGIMILFGIFERTGALLLLFTFVLGFSAYGVAEMLDTLEILGFAFYALIIGRPRWKVVSTDLFKNFWQKLEPYALPILRVGTGLNLMVLGFSEKILAPSLTNNFLSLYDWNFMNTFFGMSNYWFAFSAGMAEFLFGLFLVLGLVTRTTTLILAMFLFTTLILLGPVELIGHLPHFSIAIVLLILGSGDKLKLKI